MIRHAIRRLRATPAFTALAVLSLALGLGVTTAIYSTLASVLWSPSAVRDTNRVVVVTKPQASDSGTQWRNVMTEGDFDAIRAAARSVSEVSTSRLMSATVDDGTKTVEIMAEAVTGNYFQLTELAIVRGRGLQEYDERSDQQQALVLSRAFWESKLGGDQSIVGANVRVSGHAFLVVGIAGAGEASARDLFGMPRLGAADVWITHTGAALVDGTGRDRASPSLTVIARVGPGQDVKRVVADLSALAGSLDATDPLPRESAARQPVRGLSAATMDSVERSSLTGATRFGAVVLVFVGLVLMVACTNIANLAIGRGVGRQWEFGVRRALGATRGRLIIEQLAESGVVVVLGTGGGLLLAGWLCRVLTSDLPVVGTRTLLVRPELDARAFLVMGAALVVSLAVFGIGPALHLTRSEKRSPLVGGSSETARWRGRRWLIASQVSISTALLVLTSAALGGVVNLARHDSGFDLSRLSVAVVNFRPLEWDNARINRAVAALDNLTETGFGSLSVALTSGLPIGLGGLRGRFGTLASGNRETMAVTLAATPSILKTLGVPLLRGRVFDQHEVTSKGLVVVISERVAHQLFDTADAVGREVTYDDGAGGPRSPFLVIGITRDTDVGDLFDRRAGAVYLPLSFRRADGPLTVLVRSDDAAAMTTALAQIVHRADPDLAPAFLGTGPRLLTPAYVLLRAAASFAGGLSILAVALAMLGLFGVLSHFVAKRTREIGVRLALGASASDVRRMVIADGIRPVFWGIVFGLLAGAGARMVIQRTLIGSLAATDVTSFALVAALLLVTGLVASAIPARRASRVDPSVALRDL
jgi:predicted permease